MTDVAQEAGQDYPPEREVGEVAISEEMLPAAPANHPAATRRQEIQTISKFFKQVAVPPGTQQAEAILTVRDRARVMALTISERVPNGAEKDNALKAVAEAMFWANQGISHR